MESKKVGRGTGIANVNLPVRAAVTALVAIVLLSTAVLLFATTARAEPSPTPNGSVGACNMLQSWPGVGPGVPSGGGMENAMTVDAAQGNAGMHTAVANSGSGC